MSLGSDPQMHPFGLWGIETDLASPQKQHWEPHDVLGESGTRAITASSMSITYLPGPCIPEIMGMPQSAAKRKGNWHLSYPSLLFTPLAGLCWWQALSSPIPILISAGSVSSAGFEAVQSIGNLVSVWVW